MNMFAGWSQNEGSYVYDCLFGCHAGDFESTWEAEVALAEHDCEHRRFPGGTRPLKKDGMA